MFYMIQKKKKKKNQQSFNYYNLITPHPSFWNITDQYANRKQNITHVKIVSIRIKLYFSIFPNSIIFFFTKQLVKNFFY